MAGIRVLDLSRILAGPWATQTLADLGAQVIKIEKPGLGDDTRSWGPPFVGDGDQRVSTYFLCCNRGKKSVTIDFTKRMGRDLVRRLANESDIFVENFKVGGLAKYGLDFETLRKENPRLIYCSITGFGQFGPYAHRQGYDALIQAMGGLMSITGEAEGSPQKVGVAITDILTGMYASTAILAALNDRHRTKMGQHIDLSLMGVQIAALANQAGGFLGAGYLPARQGTAHPSIVPYQAFETSDGHLMLTVANDTQFASFCKASGLKSEARFATNELRVKNRKALIKLISGVIKKKATAKWVSLSEEFGFSCGPINSLDEVFADEHVVATQTVTSLQHAVLGDLKTVKNPIGFSRTPIGLLNAAPVLGQHTGEVLRELGLKSSEIDKLRADKVV